MIAEAVEWLTTPCPRWARDLGYLSEAIAVRHRARRCAAHWASHQANTRAAILAAADRCGVRDHALILGAGLCLDVPLDDLCRRFGRVTLVDAVRLRGVRLPGNARYVTADAHGGAEGLFDDRGGRSAGNPLVQFGPADFSVSVNLISQLPILPVRAMRRRGLLDDRSQGGLIHRIMAEHVSDLTACGGIRLLIGDLERWESDAENPTPVASALDLPEPVASWRWPVAPPGELAAGATVQTTVGVWRL